MEQLLTEGALDIIRKHCVFATGILPDNPKCLNMTRSGKDLRWIAKTGEVGDWAIYCYWADYDETYVARHGDKVTSENHIRKCVPCSDAAFKRYRY